jgi:hypothetical protein
MLLTIPRQCGALQHGFHRFQRIARILRTRIPLIPIDCTDWKTETSNPRNLFESVESVFAGMPVCSGVADCVFRTITAAHSGPEARNPAPRFRGGGPRNPIR